MSSLLLCDGWCNLVGVDKENDPPYIPIATNPNAAYAVGWELMVHSNDLPSIARQVLLWESPADEAWKDFCRGHLAHGAFSSARFDASPPRSRAGGCSEHGLYRMNLRNCCGN